MKRVLITGGNGFLGKALVEEFERNPGSVDALMTFRSSEYDLRNKEAVQDLLADMAPDTIIHLAAVVGGIGANMKHPGQFCYENLVMGVHLIEEARLRGVNKFVMTGTICSYPKFTEVPFKEKDLWNGYPEETNAPYGLAKKILGVMLDAYRQEYGMNGVVLLPVNLYGPRDNFDLESSHVIPAMLRKFHNAKVNGDLFVPLWGDGSPSREFLYVDDAARAIRLATERYNSSDPVNIGSNSEISMEELAELVKKTVEYDGNIHWDTSKPNGQPRRCLDTRKAKQCFGFTANMTLAMGLQLTYDWFVDNYKDIEEAEYTRAAVEHKTDG